MKPLSYEGPLQRERLHYLDWLCVLAVLGVFYARTADIFDLFYWHFRGEQQSTGLMVLIVFGTQWGMSLFFFLAGTSAWFALSSRTSGQFMSERFKRLIIPAVFEARTQALRRAPFSSSRAPLIPLSRPGI